MKNSGHMPGGAGMAYVIARGFHLLGEIPLDECSLGKKRKSANLLSRPADFWLRVIKDFFSMPYAQ